MPWNKLLQYAMTLVLLLLLYRAGVRRRKRKALAKSEPTSEHLGHMLTPTFVYIGDNDSYYHSRLDCTALSAGAQCRKVPRSDAEMAGKVPCENCMFEQSKP